MATGLAIMGFGGGAIIGAPLIDRLVDAFYRPPEYLGTRESVEPVLKDGRYFAISRQGQQPVILISGIEAAKLPHDVKEGVYVVGTGSSGVAQSFNFFCAAYIVVIVLAAFYNSIPGTAMAAQGMDPAEQRGRREKHDFKSHGHR
jgi:hypothetical protein